MGLASRETDAAFADMICADPQWLRAEFDALISASFGQPPVPPPAPPWVPPHRRPPYPSSGPRPWRFPVVSAFSPAAAGHRRQRSPPS
jgi:hypothetical protein